VRPGGVTFDAATGLLSRTPTAGSGGTYTLHFSAANGIGSAAGQTFTLTVDEAPSITSTTSATYTAGSAGSFTITTTGFPTAALTATGTLPSRLTFTDNGNGTALLAGTPDAGSAGTYVFTIRAHNGTGGDATQTFSLVVSPPPPPVPGARPITAQLITVQVGKKRKKKELMVEVLYADTGVLKSEFPAPFQRPAFKNIQLSLVDSNGDCIPDAVLVTAQQRKRNVSAVFPG
jgi:hypothetical protein